MFKSQVDVNESTDANDPVVELVEFAHPKRDVFDPPGRVKSFIIPVIARFVNGISLSVTEEKIGDANTVSRHT